MSRRATLLLLSVVFASMSGCILNNMSATEKLRDSVVGLNDECRWNRLDLATQRVAPIYQARFRATHFSWHRHFQIADSEIVNVEVGEDRDNATSFVLFQWYDHRTMLLANTTLKQRWRRTINGYVLIGEEVADGDPRLLEIPESMRSGDSAEDEEEPAEETAALENAG